MDLWKLEITLIWKEILKEKYFQIIKLIWKRILNWEFIKENISKSFVKFGKEFKWRTLDGKSLQIFFNLKYEIFSNFYNILNFINFFIFSKIWFLNLLQVH